MATVSHVSSDELQVRPGEGTGSKLLSVLAQLCAPMRDPEREARCIRSFAASGPSWSAVLGAAADHSVVPLVCKRLLEFSGDALPAFWRDRFRQEFVANAHRNLLMSGELVRVLRTLGQNGVQAVPFKGPALAQRAYGDLSLRQFSDLDIVLPHSQIAQAHALLESLGCRSESAAAAMEQNRIPGQYAYRNTARDILIELHTEKTLRYLPVPLDWNALSARMETVLVGGQPLQTFSAEDAMMLLCVHGTKHFWTRLAWICDIAQLAQARNDFDWTRAENIAHKMRCYRMWLLGLALAQDVFGVDLPEVISRKVQRDSRVAAMSHRVRTQYLLSGESAINAKERIRFRSGSQDNFATSLRQLSVFATRPTDDDWNSHSLPQWAAPLYAILRPLRILRNSGRN
jgi:hypothetical protein